jgi:predicted dehydrogenase
MAISLGEADAMVEGCLAAGVKLAIGASRSWDPAYNRMRELIEIGEIGDVLQVNGFGRCTLSSNGSHLLTLVAYLAGGPLSRCEWVFGQMESDTLAASDDDLQGYGGLQFSNGVQAYVRTTNCGAADWEFEVIGTKGRLRALNDAEDVEFWKMAAPTLPGRRREPARHLFPLPMAAERANVRTVRNLVASLETGAELNCNGEAGRQALEIAIAMRESHRRGGTKVTLPLQDRSLRINSSETLHGDEPVALRRAQLSAKEAVAR